MYYISIGEPFEALIGPFNTAPEAEAYLGCGAIRDHEANIINYTTKMCPRDYEGAIKQLERADARGV